MQLRTLAYVRFEESSSPPRKLKSSLIAYDPEGRARDHGVSSMRSNMNMTS